MALTVVIGPPAAGKSTWVQEHAKPGDIVIDFDKLALALTIPGGDPHDHPPAVTGVARAARNAAIEVALKHIRGVDVYLIHSNPGERRMAQYEAMGARIVTIDPGRDVVRERCKSERPSRMFAVIDEWYRDNAPGGSSGGRRTAPAPVHSFPAAVASRDW